MKTNFQELESIDQTVREVQRIGTQYAKDLLLENPNQIKIASMTPQEFFNFVRSLPYVRDPNGVEYLNRPFYSLFLAGSGHPFDCDDRTILSVAYFTLQNLIEKIQNRPEKYKTRILVTGRFNFPHHIYLEFKEIGSDIWIPFDPTYPHNEFGIKPYEPGFLKIYE